MASWDLTQANTLRLPCVAEQYAAPTTLAALQDVLHQARQQRRPMTLLGGGSNVLLPSQLSGVVIRPSLQQWWLERRGREVLAYVGAGVNWHALVMALAARGLWGCENLALIPGDCGAAPVQNIGAYGVELADVLAAARKAEAKLAQARHRLDAAARRIDTRGWVVARRERTRHLIELGGLVQKAGLVELTDDDRATLYGALLELAAKAREDGNALSLWKRRGKRAFDAESNVEERLP